MAPPTVSVLAATVTVRLPPSVTAPVPRLRLWVPAKLKLPSQLCAMFVARVSAPPLALSSAPPLIVSAPVPSAEAWPSASVPALSVVPPD